MDNIAIRRATSSDVEGIVRLRLLSQEHSEESNPSIWRITEEGKKLLEQKVENDLADSNVCVMVAEANGEIMGFVQGEVATRGDYTPRTVGHVSLIYILKQFRRKGVGRHLMKKLCEFFDSNKAEHLTVRYIIGNREAEGFWRRLGFEPIITTSVTHLKELNFKLEIMVANR
jgi:ribosomal protein S18 acetylase RimI-like enzyme